MTTQTWNSEGYARNARFVTDLGMPVLELLAPRPGEHILDVGCGDGVLTRKAVLAGAPLSMATACLRGVTGPRPQGSGPRILQLPQEAGQNGKGPLPSKRPFVLSAPISKEETASRQQIQLRLGIPCSLDIGSPGKVADFFAGPA